MNLEISNNLKTLRIKNGMTQKELAEKLHVSFQSVSKWELGKSLPSLDLLVEMSYIYKISVDEILGIKNKKRRKGIMYILDKFNESINKECINHFIITWKDRKIEIDINEYEKLKSLGVWPKSSGYCLRIRTSKSRKEIESVFNLETGMNKDDFSIMGLADLNFTGFR